MRRARLTYDGAYHHIMNRGILGEQIFPDASARNKFVKLLKEKTVDMKINLLAYCVLSNHYHLVVQNSSGQLSDFIKRLAGSYAIYYRLRFGGKGYVFQNRYKSTLVQKDNYLRMLIIYLLLNPMKSGLVKDPFKYRWSSINEYFTENLHQTAINRQMAESLFNDKLDFEKSLREWSGGEIEIKFHRMGKIMGNDTFVKQAVNKFDRRTMRTGMNRRRKKDYILTPAEIAIKQFEMEHDVKLNTIDTNTIIGKRLRAKLLINLKDAAGLKYTEIQKITIFENLQMSSLGTLYKRAKKFLK